jgi:hypothetical protein
MSKHMTTYVEVITLLHYLKKAVPEHKFLLFLKSFSTIITKIASTYRLINNNRPEKHRLVPTHAGSDRPGSVATVLWLVPAQGAEVPASAALTGTGHPARAVSSALEPARSIPPGQYQLWYCPLLEPVDGCARSDWSTFLV